MQYLCFCPLDLQRLNHLLSGPLSKKFPMPSALFQTLAWSRTESLGPEQALRLSTETQLGPECLATDSAVQAAQGSSGNCLLPGSPGRALLPKPRLRWA